MPAAARRLIAHLDMDAFYASVELLRYPDLRGRPVVIGGGRRHQPLTRADGSRAYARLREYTGRGVITTSTYEARALGVHSGMGVMKAALLAPDAVLLPIDFDEYRKYSRLFKAAVREVAPLVEDRGIDEIYIDLTELPGAQLDAGRAAAQQLKDAVRAATGLSCSVAVAPNKLLAKIGSELDKPDGLTLRAASGQMRVSMSSGASSVRPSGLSSSEPILASSLFGATATEQVSPVAWRTASFNCCAAARPASSCVPGSSVRSM